MCSCKNTKTANPEVCPIHKPKNQPALMHLIRPLGPTLNECFALLSTTEASVPMCSLEIDEIEAISGYLPGDQ